MIPAVKKSLLRKGRLFQKRLLHSGCYLSSNQKPILSQETCSHGKKCTFAAAAAAAVALATVSGFNSIIESACDDNDTMSSANPLWPKGVLKNDVDEFVDSILADKSMNMSSIPDVLERRLYVATVTMTANVLYKALSQVHGVSLFGHKLELLREATKRWNGTGKEHVGIDEKVLEEVAERLLANSSINQTLVPDFLERQLYFNCLRIIFHLLDTIAASFCITICGHDLRIYFEPTSKMMKPASSQTEVDIAKLVEYAKQELGDDKNSLYGELQAQLLASLYGLVLGIIDDMLANIDIQILSDRVSVDVISISDDEILRTAQKTRDPLPPKNKTYADKKGTSLPKLLASFTVGIGIGAIAVIGTSRN